MIKILKRFNSSLVGYVPIKVLDGLIGMVTLRVYTTLFAPNVFGLYNIINPTINMIFLTSLGWLSHSAIRFAHEYTETEEKKKQYFSCLFLVWILVFVVLVALYFILYSLFPSIFSSMNVSLAITILFVFLGYSMNQILIGLLLYLNKRTMNVILLLFASTLKLILTVILFNSYGEHVIVIFISHATIDIIIGVIAFIGMHAFKYIRIKAFSINVYKKFLKYGYPLIGLSLTMFMLNVSDRYLIKLFYSNYEVGIYTSNYSVPAAIFTMLMFGMNKGVYPKLLSAWKDKQLDLVEERLTMGTKYFIMLALPSAVGLFLMSDIIAKLFINIRYFEGHHVIGIVAIAMFFMGLSEYANKGWELSSHTIPIFIHSLIAMIVNISLNIILIPRLGYIIASYTTVIAFLIYFLLCSIRRSKVIKWHLPIVSLFRIMLSASIMGVAVYFLKNLLGNRLIHITLIIAIAVLLYFGVLLVTGELKYKLTSK